jgi:hypothetical protein
VRPIRTTAEIADAVGCDYEGALGLVGVLKALGLAEPVGRGYRRTQEAEERYTVLDEAEIERRRLAWRQARHKPGRCSFCGRGKPPSRAGKDYCSRKCEREMAKLREAA